MQIVFEEDEVTKGFGLLRKCLRAGLGKPTSIPWSFPGHGTSDSTLPTWSEETAHGHLTVGVGEEGDWDSRTPVLIALEAAYDRISPVVEVNVPATDDEPDRQVGGCFARDADKRWWLCHRGSVFTASGARIPKEAIHRYFQKWLVEVDDDGRRTDVIPIARLDEDEFAIGLRRFAEAVGRLKEVWGNHDGNDTGVDRDLGWRDDINFPDEIERATSDRKASYDYRHGPIQQTLQEYLRGVLAKGFRVALNARLDLAILRKGSIAAIFEVKTALGNQLYAGIGQLLVYRQVFSPGETPPLFLVVPADVGDDAVVEATTTLLESIGITLVLQNGEEFVLGDGRDLRDAFDPTWLR
ncbi:MAG: hypothetical protein HY909_15865 [Deltaproteobacteria bacterium]|nr:hypothetical protein [Deltaproteobacteria bacterium]